MREREKNPYCILIAKQKSNKRGEKFDENGKRKEYNVIPEFLYYLTEKISKRRRNKQSGDV
jgi:hypothetical protein